MRSLRDDDFDENGQLKDGRRYRVPMTLMDSARGARVTDASGDSGLGLHRRGFRVIADAAGLDARQQAYAEYERRITDAWRHDAAAEKANSPPTGEGSSEFRGAQLGDLCTINGSPGHLKMLDGKLVCIPDLGRDANGDPRQAAIDAYDLEIANRWRGSGQ